jgi:hypothetical protein
MKKKPLRRVHKCTCATCVARPHSAVAQQHRAINRVVHLMDERNRRRFVGVMALQWGRGGVQRLIEVTGISRNSIVRGRNEVEHPRQAPGRRIRRPGGGRKRVEKNSRAL